MHSVLLAEPMDGHEGFVNTPLLFWAYPAYELTEPSGVDGSDLLNQHASDLPEHVYGTDGRRHRASAMAGSWVSSLTWGFWLERAKGIEPS
jgi:hypothetical protein